jgi:outer membrane protein OmpA-like peptidoglycan-associated protein
MKIHRIITALILILVTCNAMSQDHKVKMGNKYYDKFDYAMSVKYYEPVKDKSIEVLRNLAHSYYMTGDWENAKTTYEQIYTLPQKTFDDGWNYFLVLQQLGQYDKAIALLPELSKLSPNDVRVNLYLKAGDYYKNLLAATPKYELKNLKMNSSHQEFSTAFMGDKVVYATSKNKYHLFKRVWVGNHKGYLNLFVSNLPEDKEFKSGKPLTREANKKYHDGPVTFNEAGNFMVLTRNNYKSKSSDGTRNLQLFSSELVDGEWSKPIAFPYNNAEYSIGQASLTPDGKFMFFVSDMPGGVGGTDLYVVERKSDGNWGPMVNLKEINTEGNEMFPVYHADGVLFFSSNGYPGLGGLDVFVVPVSGEQYNIFGKPENMGTPINGTYDDFALTFDKNQKFGYLTSNRAEGQGDDDIYYVNVLQPKKFKKIIRGVTKTPENVIVPNAEVSLTLNGKPVAKTISDDQGKFEFVVSQQTTFDLKGIKPQYSDGLNTANTDVPDEIVYSDLVLDQIKPFGVKFIVKDKTTEKEIPNATIHLKDNITFEEDKNPTDNTGSYLKDLPKAKLNDNISYYLTTTHPDYVTNTQNYYQKLLKSGVYEYIIYLEPLKQTLVLGEDLAKKFNINPIYFDLDKSDIRPDAAIELDKIVQIMNAYPDIVIELGSHTDCRAPYEYNMALSERRAKSSAEYIRKRITNPQRIYGKGYGETRLVNYCECEGDYTAICTEEEHQMNRRTEFRVVAIGDKKVKITANETPKTKAGLPLIPKGRSFDEKGTYYRVQILNSPKLFELKPENFNGFDGIAYYFYNNRYQYTVGKSANKEEMIKLQQELLKFYPEAFLVKFIDGIKQK